MSEVLPEPGPARCLVDVRASQATLEALGAAEHAECYLCGAANPWGLGARFQVQPDGSVTATLRCRDALRSYAETLHGGVVTALLDAAMTNVLFSIGVVAVTAELKVRFLAPAAPESDLVVRAAIERDDHPLFHVRAELEQAREVRARASGRFLVRGYS